MKNDIRIEKREKKWAVCLVLFHLAVVLFTGFLRIPIPDGMDRTAFVLLENWIYQGGMIMIIVLGLHDYLKRMSEDLRTRSFGSVKTTVLRAFLYMFLASLLAGILSEILTHTDQEALNQTMLDDYMGKYPVAVLLLSLAGAFCEEVIYRGVLFQLFERAGKKPAVVITSFLFGFLHILSTIMAGEYTGLLDLSMKMLPYFLLGMVLALEYAQERNLWINIMTHGLWNLMVFVIRVSLV